ncbi:MAG: hypothetical protein HC897_05420 [Thermoanaerobaculia bacterium]|nr:hypothetical protein [Thermoanaerobaculia bacterium]
MVRAEPANDRAPLVSEAWPRFGLGEPFRIALCPLVGKAHPAFDLTMGDRGFRACVHLPMIEPAGHAVREQLELILGLAVQEGVHLLVFPELTVDVATREWLTETLKGRKRSDLPLGVVAGSFHVERATSDRPYNESRFVDGRGWELLEHQKRGRFRVTRKQVGKLLDRGFFCDVGGLRARLSQLPVVIEEHIEPGTRLELLEAAIGQMAVLICADAIDDVSRHQLRDAVAHLRPDFLFLPAMSPKTALFDELTASMERRGVSTFFVNAHCLCPRGQTLAAVCLSLFRGKDDPPTRVRWRQGVGLEEWASHAGLWKRLRQPVAPFSWLRGPREKRLGLVVDLGAYWR